MIQQSKVLLPAWIFERAKGDVDVIRKLSVAYIKKSYPNYLIKKISGPFAICDRDRGVIE